MRCIAGQLTVISLKDPRFQYQCLKSIHEHEQLRREAKVLLSAKSWQVVMRDSLRS